MPLQEELADKLAALSGLSEVFFCNSGCEANEAAIKLARFYGNEKGIANPAIIVMEGAFHGRTLATLSATANPKTQEGFAPLVEGFVRVPYNDFDAVKNAVKDHPNIVAILFEVVQGEGGLRAATWDYQRALRTLCDEKELLLMCDEVQCGMGRTGTWFAFEPAKILPDVITLAKGLGGGVPIGACLAGKRAAHLFGYGNHGSTFGGNQLATAAALTVISVIEKEKLLDNAKKLGNYIRAQIGAKLANEKGVKGIRGQGLMMGIVLDRPCGELVAQAMEVGLLINVTSGNVIRLLPPLNFSQNDADVLLNKLIPLIQTFLNPAS